MKAMAFTLFYILSACSHSGQTGSEPRSNIPTPRSSILISMEREFDECFGKCPVYKVSVHVDGSVEFVGIENVKRKGLVRKQIALDSVVKLKDVFLNAQFFSMKDEYVKGKNCSVPVLSDADMVILTFVENGKSKRIKHYQGCMRTTKNTNQTHKDLDSLINLEKAVVQETNIEQLIE